MDIIKIARSASRFRVIYIKDFTVVQSFKSRQNRVELVSDSTGRDLSVIKQFSDTRHCRLETALLGQLYAFGIHVPAIYKTNSRFIRMAYIDGPTLCDYLNEQELANAPVADNIVLSLAEQLDMLYSSPPFHERHLIREDVNLRNCLVQNNQVYLIDFESAKPGRILSDISGMIAFYLTYDPAFSDWKIDELRHIRLLIGNRYPINAASMTDELEHWLKILGERRKKNYLQDNAGSLALIREILAI